MATPTSLKGTTLPEFLSLQVVSRTKQGEFNPVNTIMLVDTGCPYVFLAAKTWNAIGVKVEDIPNDEADVLSITWSRPRPRLLESL